MGTTHAVISQEAHEHEIARDLIRRMLLVSPAVLLLAGVLRGPDGLVSAAIGLALVAANFFVSAHLVSATAHKSPGTVMGVVLGGYLVRLGVLFGIVLALSLVPWIDVAVLALTIAVVHLALLGWETRHVSLTLGAPGLKPARK